MNSRTSRPSQKRKSATPAAIAKLIKKAWPDGIVDMPIEEDESYFWDIYDKLKAKISKLPGVSMFYERCASPETRSIDDWDEDGLDEVWHEGTRSYHLFVIPPQTRIKLPQNDVQSEFDTEGFD